MTNRTVIYVFKCGCWLEHEESQLAHEMTKAERAHIYLKHGSIDRNRRYCKEHGSPLDYRICYCLDCSAHIEYRSEQGGNIPARCPACAAERLRKQRNEASARQRARRREQAGVTEKKQIKIKRGDYCRYCAGCEAAGKINGSQAACLRCPEFVPWFRGVDPVEIAETMRTI